METRTENRLAPTVETSLSISVNIALLTIKASP
jgi:hypothetical protein